LAGAGPTGTIEDTTAELLRPMLRQWLADNMPRMVEKALHIEVAESVKTGKKFTGQ
jgi:cell pole-organizing protein PopZ